MLNKYMIITSIYIQVNLQDTTHNTTLRYINLWVLLGRFWVQIFLDQLTLCWFHGDQ